MPPTPAANPSSPSIQLMALVMPTSHNIVTSKLKPVENCSTWPPGYRSTALMRTPASHAMVATRSCTQRRGSGGSEKRSSTRPMQKNASDPPMAVQISIS